MKHILRIGFCLLIGAMGAFACVAPEQPSADVKTDSVEISLAMSVGRIQAPATRMTDVVVQNTGTTSFRGIERIFAIPFVSGETIQSGDFRYGTNLQLPQLGLPANQFGADAQGGAFSGLVYYNNAHLYNPVYIRKGVRSVLVYGKAIDETISVQTDSIAFKAGNGSLYGYGLDDGIIAGDVHFDLDPMTDGVALQTELDGILAYLNTIAGTTVSYDGTVYRWANLSDSGMADTFTEAFRRYTSEKRPFAGSSVALGQILTRLYQTLYPLRNGGGASGALATAILSNIAGSSLVTVSTSGNPVVSVVSDFPARYGVPQGAVTLQWTGDEFWRPTKGAGSQAVTLSSFCYPPSLWYYANSLLAVSEQEDLAEEYNDSHQTWASITSLYSASSLVVGGIQSVAVREPLQYGVALLNVYVNRVESDQLRDSKSNSVLVSNSSFPMTGIIVGDQRNLAFDFTPTGDAVYYVYDSGVNNGTTPKNYISSLASGISRRDVQVLTTQTLPQEDLHLALEFQNNSGADFYGHDGDVILAGSRFYLFAKLKYSQALNSSGENIDCILLQDHVTRVTFRVDGLEEAYSTIPDLRDPQLQVGVRADLEWVLSTPIGIAVK